MADFNSYVAGYGTRTGKRQEQLVDKLALAVQSETPFQDSIGRGDASASSEFRWVEEQLDIGRGGNAQVDGIEYTNLNANFRDTPTLTSRTGSTQLHSRGYIVDDTYRNEDKASVKSQDELSEQEYNKMIEIKTDLEVDLLSTNTGNVGSSSTARQLTGAFAQVASADLETQSGSTTKYNNATPDTSAGTAVPVGPGTRILVDTVAGALYENGGLSYNMGNAHVKDANMIIMNPANKIRFDRSLDDISNTRRELGAQGTKLGVRFTNYMSTFGNFEVMPDKYCDENEILIYNPQNWALQVHTNWYVKELGANGLHERRMVAGEFGLMHRNQFTSGRIAGIGSTGTPLTEAQGLAATI